ncbi:hypothetical protein B0H17DRAFT_850456, partial [Mycena rosella]
KIASITADNATNNDVMTAVFSARLPAFGGERHRTRCFDHIINLVAKSFLRLFD